MVQYTNILIASAVAAAAPALAAPFAYLETRDLVNIDAREPVLGAMADIVTTGAARRVVTAPLQEKIKDAYNANPIRAGPGPFTSKYNAGHSSTSQTSGIHHSQASDALREPIHFAHAPPAPQSKILTELAKHNANRPRSLEYLDAREPVLGSMVDLVTTGASRRVITGPLQEKVKDAATQKPFHSGPGPAQEAMNRIKAENASSGHSKQSPLDAHRDILNAAKEASRPIVPPAGAQHPPSKILTELAHHNANHPRDLEYLDARAPVLGSMVDLVTTGASRRVITGPLQEKVKGAATQKPLHSGPGPAQEAMNKHKAEDAANDRAKQSAADARRALSAQAKAASQPIKVPASAQHPPSRILSELARHNANQRRSLESLYIRELEDLLERSGLYLD